MPQLTIPVPSTPPANLERESTSSRRTIHNHQEADPYPMSQLEQACAWLAGRQRVALPCWVGPTWVPKNPTTWTLELRLPRLPWARHLWLGFYLESLRPLTVRADISIDGVPVAADTDMVCGIDGLPALSPIVVDVGANSAPHDVSGAAGWFDLEVVLMDLDIADPADSNLVCMLPYLLPLETLVNS